MSEIADILDRAADLIEPEGAWTQGKYASDMLAASVAPTSPDALCFCLVGATIHAAGLWAITDDIHRLVGIGEHEADVVDWNDAPERTQAEVVAKLREAAAKARAQS